MDTGIGRSLGTSYFRIADQLNGEELSYLRRTRDLVDGELLDSEVLPVINDYWERAEFPWPLIKKLAKLRIVGDGIDRYGCSPMSPIAAGLVNMELNLALETLGAPGRRRVGNRGASQGITGGEGHAGLRREADRRQGVAARCDRPRSRCPACGYLRRTGGRAQPASRKPAGSWPGHATRWRGGRWATPPPPTRPP